MARFKKFFDILRPLESVFNNRNIDNYKSPYFGNGLANTNLYEETLETNLLITKDQETSNLNILF